LNRLTKSVCVSLLVAVPLAYLVWAAVQSTGGSENKKKVAAAVHPLHGRPDLATRNIYNMPVPYRATGPSYFETNSWHTSSLYARFTTVPRGLDWFLHRIGTSRSALVEGEDPITARQQETFGWHLDGPATARQHRAGVHLDATGKGKPAYNLLVNLTDPKHPQVYVVSTITF
jgi:hypothetical protein